MIRFASHAGGHWFAIPVTPTARPLTAWLRIPGIPGTAVSRSPYDLRHRRISLLHLGGVPWATIGQAVSQRDLAVTANTYSHVLTDETELDYAGCVEAL
jgi:integrase